MSGKTTVYHEDGTKTVSDQDVGGTWSYEITYDAEGSVVEEIRYEYEQDEEGESIGSKGYRNGKLFAEVYQILDESGEAQGLAMVSYEEDGSKSICEYDQ